MDWLIFAGIAVAVIGLGYLAQHFGWIDLTNKTKSSGTHGGVMGIGDEIFNPSRYESQIELDRQTVLPAPAPVAGDGDKNVYQGQVRIDLDETREDTLPPRAGRHSAG